MPDSPQSHRTVLPETLRLQLADFRRHLWRIKVLEAIAAGLIGLLVSFLLVYGLDRVWQTPGFVRLLILLSGVSLFTIFAPYWLHRWVWKQRRETQLARLIAKRYPGLGDRLLGVIELQDQEGSGDTLSPRLREAAMAAVAAETGRRKLTEALPPQRHRRLALAAMALAGVAATAFALTPKAGVNALQRWLMPLSDTERYTFARLVDPPHYLAVPFGEAFDIELKLSSNSEQRPPSATGRYALQSPIEAALEKGLYRFTFPGQQDPATVTFRIGDLVHQMRVEPVLRPAAESVRAVVTAPSYTEIPERIVDLNSGVVSAVEGGTIVIEMEMSRALDSGTYGPSSASTSEMVSSAGSPTHEALGGPLVISGNLARTPDLTIKQSGFEIPFTWKDQLGLEGEPGFRIRVDALKDAAPTCYLQGIDRQKAILPEETVDFEVLAEDDLGVKKTGIEWSGEFTRPTNETAAKGELELGTGGPEMLRLIRQAAFSPAAFGVSPQKITLRGYVEDYLPQRGRIYSEPITIYVLTRDEHAQILKNRFDRQIAELEDLARREQSLLEENERIERMEGTDLQKDENRNRLSDQQMEEAETSRRTEELKKQMEQLMQDSARNGDIDKETLQKLAEALKSVQELAEQDVPDVEKKLGDSQEQSNTPEKAKEDVNKAVEQQKKVVEKMRDAAEKANDANRRFEAGTFVNRLKKAANEENGIVAALKGSFEKVLGMRSSQVDPADKYRLSESARQQTDTASDVRWIQEDLAHYQVRSQDENLKALLDEMRSSGIDIGLEEVRNHISNNFSYQAAEGAALWASKLSAWAGKLESEKNKDGGSGGDGGPPNSEDEDFEFMLRVMKMIQQEQDLRARTRALEQLRRDESSSNQKP